MNLYTSTVQDKVALYVFDLGPEKRTPILRQFFGRGTERSFFYFCCHFEDPRRIARGAFLLKRKLIKISLDQ